MKTAAIVILFLAATFPAASQELSLETVKQLSLEHESIQRERTNVRQSELHVEIARSGRLPRVDFDASYQYVSEFAKIPVAIPGLPPSTVSFGDGHNTLFGIKASMPLFSGFRLQYAQDMQEERSSIARQTLTGRTLEMRNRVTLLYRQAQLARKAANTLFEQRRVLEEQLRLARSRFEQGQALAYDTLVLSTRLSELQVNHMDAMNAYDKTIFSLMQLCGRQERFDVSDELALDYPPASLSLDSLAALAWDLRYEAKTLEASRAVHDLGARQARGTFYPSLLGFASYSYGRPGVDPVANDWMNYYTLGVSLNWNLWSWGADADKAEIEELEMQKVDLQLAEFRRSLRTGIASILEDLRVVRQTLALLDEQIAQESEKQRLLSVRYAQGLATSSELVDAETSLTTARLRRDRGRIEHTMKLTELAATLGQDF